MRETIKTAGTVEQAIRLGCEELGLEKDEVLIEVLEMPQKRLFGLLGSTPAKVRVYIEEPGDGQPAPAPAAASAPAVKEQSAPTAAGEQEQPAPERDPAEVEANRQHKAQIACDYIARLLEKMQIEDVSIEQQLCDSNLTLNLKGGSVGMLIGRRGETLDAIQYLTGLCCNKGGGDYLKVTVDSGDYREKRRQTLEALAKKIAASAVKSGRSTTLEPMNPYERRIIHSAVQTVEGATSCSVGEDPYRKVVISSQNPRKPDRPERRDRRSGGRGRGPRPPRREFSSRDHVLPQDSGQKTVTAAPKSDLDDADIDLPLYGKIDL